MSEYTALIRKYTGHDITEDDYLNRIARTDAGYPVQLTLTRLASAEKLLANSVRKLRDIADRIEKNLQAGPEDRVMSLNSLGELQNDRTDQLIATRDMLIELLQAQTHNLFANT